MDYKENEEDCGKHTCVQYEYFDMWDMTCSNIDNADEDMNRMTIYSDTPACQYFTPEIMEKVK